MMLKTFLEEAKRNEAVYLPRVRDAFLKEGKRPFYYIVTLPGTKQGMDFGKEGKACREEEPFYKGREGLEKGEIFFSLPLPEAEGGEEELFLTSYVYANLFNLISCLGAKRIRVYTDLTDPFLGELALGLNEGFQVSLPMKERCGYGRCLNVNERMLAFLGEGRSFCFEAYSLEDKGFLLRRERLEKANGALNPGRQEKALSLEERLPGKKLLGMDIGGTDIKLAVSSGEKLCFAFEYDWDPSELESARAFLSPIELLVRLCQAGLRLWERGEREAFLSLLRTGKSLSPEEAWERAGALLREKGLEAEGFDGIGISFPDVVVRDVIVGGETDKTAGIRRKAEDYEKEFALLSRLKDELAPFLREGGEVHICNDGTCAAFTAALEGERRGEDILCHSLGTDLGTGWVYGDGSIPPYPLECYQFLIDLGSERAGAYPGRDERSSRNVGSDLPGSIQRYASQRGVFRWAAGKHLEEFLQMGFFTWEGDSLQVPPQRRKEFLSYISSLEEAGEAFREVGKSLGYCYRELEFLTGIQAKGISLFGRLVKNPRAARWIQEGARESAPGLTLSIADEGLARSVLMRQLLLEPDWSVPQYGQAVGAIYFALSGKG